MKVFARSAVGLILLAIAARSALIQLFLSSSASESRRAQTQLAHELAIAPTWLTSHDQMLKAAIHANANADFALQLAAHSARLRWSPGDPKAWSRLAVEAYGEQGAATLAAFASHRSMLLAPNSIPIGIEQSLSAAVHWDSASTIQKHIWRQALKAAAQNLQLLISAAASYGVSPLQLCRIAADKDAYQPLCSKTPITPGIESKPR